MGKTEVERTLEQIGINPRDENGNIRSADDLTVEVMALFDQCDGADKMLLLMMLEIAKKIDDEMLVFYDGGN